MKSGSRKRRLPATDSAQAHLQGIFAELRVPKRDRTRFLSRYEEDEVAVVRCIKHLLEYRKLVISVLRSIEEREVQLASIIDQLHHVKFGSTVDRETFATQVEEAKVKTLQTIEVILQWRSSIRRPNQPFVWKGINYLSKISRDLQQLDDPEVRELLGDECDLRLFVIDIDEGARNGPRDIVDRVVAILAKEQTKPPPRRDTGTRLAWLPEEVFMPPQIDSTPASGTVG